MTMRLDELWLHRAALPPEVDQVRAEVREFLAVERASGGFTPGCNAWLEGYDPGFSRKLGERNWIGMTWPSRYGGAEQSSLERFGVIEELLAAGAPVAAHWFADRQVGPALLRYGTEQHRLEFLPAIARGECYFSIGMSEPDSGSDLASVRSTARRVDGGWALTGAKVWTTHAAANHYMITLCRTSEAGEDRHRGLSQLIVDLRDPNVHVRPIRLMGGQEHFAEVQLDDVYVPEEMLLGNEGDGWHQVNAELAHERSGPERYLSTFPLLVELLAIRGRGHDVTPCDPQLGGLVADIWALRMMSQSVARQLDSGGAPHVEAALVKDVGTAVENDIVDLAHLVAPRPLLPEGGDDYARMLAEAIQGAPGFTLRGGTTEILRGIVARAVTA
jgi:alkylation response protein AidB-like acyl-CoA dehydrogenase